MENRMLNRLDESLAIWGSPIDTDDCRTVTTGCWVAIGGGPQFKNSVRAKTEHREKPWASIFLENNLFIFEHPR
jgi:hypothetical protein